MNTYPIRTPVELVKILGERIRHRRLAANLTQAYLADKALVSRRALAQLESGGGSNLVTLASVLKALGLENQLVQLIPAPSVSPMAMLNLGMSNRRRATARKQ
ncbi:DNA-binding protein [Stenotrophomonas maltophilia]|uniref:helix-turn-helix domain-containing protein n=1 Tax=Stenotrophomonas maltophilia TaxID=40324 RepID=UPI000B4E1ED7|nr:helix-turn-helix transcriptional regulator [Stenotrophomonas maltophilia]MPS47252.1 XRE family transcriptional regulator [Stenotrophomonas sp.]MBA0385520.1 XRE family transcriptional regulator [Stenotrophomonas maltophilia]OWQ79981.1 DNA-binding protein [Stenotrophomonas maltophilia]PJK97593.1 DNA-binding protein [Stenotrophomonas maltophilia]QPX94390.1 helix-turn-helix transcriptional regulator [Stenotrophomonas maltophilia]